MQLPELPSTTPIPPPAPQPLPVHAASFLHTFSITNLPPGSNLLFPLLRRIFSGLNFCKAFHSASNTGKAGLLGGSTSQGPPSWHTRMPKSDRFRFLEAGIDPISARAADLLAYPHQHVDKNCLFRSFHSNSSHLSSSSPLFIILVEPQVWDNVRCLSNGECVSTTGTHLGHDLPDRTGNRYCINLVSVAGRPETPAA